LSGILIGITKARLQTLQIVQKSLPIVIGNKKTYIRKFSE